MNDQNESSGWPQPSSGSAALAPDPPPSRTMAIWSLVLSAMPVPPLWLVSVGLGIAVLVRSKDGRNHGKTLVIVGFGLIAAWLVVFAAIAAIAIAFEMQSEQDDAPAVRGDVFIEDVRVGDCTAGDLEAEVTLVELVSCDSRHRLETYAIFDLPAGPFPGQRDVDRLGEGGCSKRFDEYVGLSYEESSLDFQYVTPVEDIWADDRAVVCFLDTGGTTTGSLENSAR